MRRASSLSVSYSTALILIHSNGVVVRLSNTESILGVEPVGVYFEPGESYIKYMNSRVGEKGPRQASFSSETSNYTRLLSFTTD